MDARLRIGIKKNGAITALYAENILEGGPISGIGPFNIYFFGAFLNLPYKIPAIEYHGKLVYSNRSPCGTVRGQEIVLAQFCIDSLLHMVSEDIGIDPVEVRTINAIPDRLALCQRHSHRRLRPFGVHQKVLRKDRLERVSKITARRPGNRVQLCLSSVRYEVGRPLRLFRHDKTARRGAGHRHPRRDGDRPGRKHGFLPDGRGRAGDPYEDVLQGTSDSDTAILDSGMFGDRATYWDGNATIAAARDLKKQLAELVAPTLSAKPEEIEFENKRLFVRGDPERGIDWLRAVRKAYYEKGAPLYGRGNWAALDIDIVDWKTGKGNLCHGLDFIATAVEVAVDKETGKVDLIKAVHGDDAGQPIEPRPGTLEGQVNGGSAHMSGDPFG